MQHPCDAPSWSSVVDKAKLVYAVGWYNAQHNVANVSAKDHLIGSSPSFCQAVNLSQQPGVVKHMDGSGTWVFQRTDSGYTDYRVWYDDEESLGPKYQMVREAGWGGECTIPTLQFYTIVVSR